MNLFDSFGIAYAEDPMSNFLASLCRVDPTFQNRFASELAGNRVIVKELRQRPSIPDHFEDRVKGTPDFVFVLNDDSLLIAEVKTKSVEGINQLRHYQEPAFHEAMREVLGWNGVGTTLSFLSLDQPPSVQGYRSLTLERVIPLIQESSKNHSLADRYRFAAADLAEVLDRYYQIPQLTPDTSLAALFRVNHPILIRRRLRALGDWALEEPFVEYYHSPSGYIHAKWRPLAWSHPFADVHIELSVEAAEPFHRVRLSVDCEAMQALGMEQEYGAFRRELEARLFQVGGWRRNNRRKNVVISRQVKVDDTAGAVYSAASQLRTEAFDAVKRLIQGPR